MLKEHLIILFSSYFMSNLFLIPIFILNLSGLLRFARNSYQVKIHKYTVILVLLCPIFIYLYSVPFQTLNFHSNYTEIIPKTYEAVFSDNIGEKQNNIHTTSLPSSSVLLPDNTKSIILDTIYFIIEYILLITLFGFIYFLFILLVQFYFLKQIDKHCIRKKSFKNLDIIYSPKIILPFSVGLLKRKVYLSDRYSPMEKQIIINHEFNHFRKNHHVWTIMESMLNYLFWYNPIAFYLRVKGTLLREMECDEYTLKKIDSYTYSKLLIKLAEFHLLKGSCFLITQNLISRHTLKKRIEKMVSPKKSKKNIVISSLIVFALIISISTILLYGKINDQTSQNEILDRIKTRYAQILIDRNKVDIEKVPQNFIDALLVSEDRDFFKHKGIKLYNIVKASVFNLFHDRERWLGASTITQQLAKQLLNQPNEKTFERKFRELKIAKVLEKNYTKHEILEMYLNSIYFGNNAWGLHQAAHTYFGHSYEKLTLKESALLVPALTAPAKYNFIKNPQLAIARQERLINSMMKLGIANSADK